MRFIALGFNLIFDTHEEGNKPIKQKIHMGAKWPRVCETDVHCFVFLTLRAPGSILTPSVLAGCCTLSSGLAGKVD